jgi:hypothetical protein
VPTEDASIQKTRGKLKVIEAQQLYQSAALQKHSLDRHFLNKLQANLSFPNTPHSIQQEEFPLPNTVISIGHKMLLKFGDNFSAARKSTARVRRKRDNRVAVRCPIAIVVMDIVDLQRPPPLAVVANTTGIHVTNHGAGSTDRTVWKNDVASARENMGFGHVEAQKVR